MISQTRFLTVEDLIEAYDKRQSCLFFDGKGIQRKLTVFQSAEEYMRIYTPTLWSDAPKSLPTYSARTQSREESGSSQTNDSYIYIMHKIILSRWWSDHIPEDVSRLILLQSCSSNFVGVDELHFTNARLSSWTENREKNPELSFEGQYALTCY